MTDQATTTKQVPAFYIFETVEVEGSRENKRVGAAFAHKTGGGFNVVINGKRFVAFPPKAKAAAESTAAGGEGA